MSQLIPFNSAYRSATRRHAVRNASAASQAVSRRRLVLPDGKHGGTYSHPMPVIRT
ncbi:MAG: hypothetical protein K2X87_10530 [Gemmataceae bacterium]|nr:hypothetical protein [Gemmataceae bacterium]